MAIPACCDIRRNRALPSAPSILQPQTNVEIALTLATKCFNTVHSFNVYP
ncbi:Unknown protein sequence [Pseudomonas syringae pv. maculicola]|nr:Unknown protein sequence [Pseudomonas syringae pv. maculicola]